MLSNRTSIPIFLLIVLLLFPQSGRAQKQAVDSTTLHPALQITSIGVPLIAEGLLAKSKDKGFRQLRNHYMPDFHTTCDDYLRFLPAAVMLGMKAAGVESRSSWGRMLTGDAFSTAIMAAAVVSLKNTCHRTRPDGSDNESFPSGHAAAAFMTATMLTKEYGHLSPWVGIGAYTVATGTAAIRMANNKHWFSDVAVGAGLGIVSTEMGYYLADLIFKDRGLNKRPQTEIFDLSDRPSFASVYVGFALPLNSYKLSGGRNYKTTTGNTIGGEGAWFFNPYLGVGGRFLLSNIGMKKDEGASGDDDLDYYSVTAGPYFSYPLTPRLLVGSRLAVGMVHYGQTDIGGSVRQAATRFAVGTGVSATLRVRRHFSFRLFLDYDLYSPAGHGAGRWLHTLTPGTSFAATL